MSKNIRLLVAGSILSVFIGCGGSDGVVQAQSTKDTTIDTSSKTSVSMITKTTDITKNIEVTDTPTNFEKFALLANGKITFDGSFETDGPLADIHSNQEIESNSRSVNVSGRITSYLGNNGTFRSVEEGVQDGKYVEFRALKVREYDINGTLPDAYILKKDGTFAKRFNNQETLADKSSVDASLEFKGGTWIIGGKDVRVELPIKSETDLTINADKLFIAGSLLVEGSLNSTGKLSINMGTPFEKGLIVDKDIIVNKLEIIGKIFGSGNFTGKSSINITGSAKIDGDVKLAGATKLNYLDTVYQAAMSDAQDDFNNTSFMLVHSQLFEDLKGKNSIVLFTFVKDDYLIDEDTLMELIETNSTKDFEFKSYLYGATLDYGSDLAKYDNLSPYYKNKALVLKKLREKGYKNIEISNSIDIAPQQFYHTFKSDGKVIGTYLIESYNRVVDGLIELTKEQREQSYKDKYDLATIEKNRAEIDDIKKDADLKIPNSKNVDLDALEASSDLNATQKALIKEFVMDNSEDLNVSINEELEKKEDNQNRIKEWIYEKDMEGEIITVDVDVIATDSNSTKRGWWKKLKRKVHRWWKKQVHKSCYHKDIGPHYLSGVSDSEYKSRDIWLRDVAYGNPGKSNYNGHCVQTAGAMMIRYLANHHNRHVTPIYDSNFINNRTDPLAIHDKKHAKSNLVQLLDKRFNGHSDGSVYPWDLFSKVPRGIKDTLAEGGIYASVWSRVNSGWWFSRSWWFKKLKKDIDNNRPVMMIALNHGWIKNHAVDIIGYKAVEYKGWACSWKPNKNWFYMGTGWTTTNDTNMKKSKISLAGSHPPKKWVRYDGRSNYWTTPATFIRVKVNSVKVDWSWWNNWWNNWWY